MHDITDNTLTLVCEEGSMITFSTREAQFHCPGGAHKGSPVTVSYCDDISDGFGNAASVEMPERYNLLIGRWLAPCTEEPEKMHGFELCEDGSVLEIGDHSIIYNHWRVTDDDTLSLAETEEGLDCDLFDVAQHWHIDHLDHSTLTISYGEMSESFARKSRN